MLKLKVLLVFIGAGTKWCVTMKDPKENEFDNYDANDSILFFILRKDLKQSDELYKVAICYERDYDEIGTTTIYNALDNEIYPLEMKNAKQILELTKQLALKQPISELAKLTYKAVNNKLSEGEFIKLFNMNNNTIMEHLCYNNFLSDKQFLFLLDKDDNNRCLYYLAENYYLKKWMQIMLFNIAKQNDDKLLFDTLATNDSLDSYIYQELIEYNNENPSDLMYFQLKNNKNPIVQELIKKFYTKK